MQSRNIEQGALSVVKASGVAISRQFVGCLLEWSASVSAKAVRADPELSWHSLS